MSTVTKKQAENLATDYKAFSDAVNANDDLGISVWGKMLLDTQKELDIELYKEKNLLSLITSADRKLQKQQAA